MASKDHENDKHNHTPTTAKGTRRRVEVSCAAWIDLLYFSSLLEEARFNPLHSSAEKAMTRLRAFHRDVAVNAGRYFPTHAMNDGAVAFRDLSPRTQSVTFDFLARTWQLHQLLNIRDTKEGFPGVRTIIGAGFRERMNSQEFDFGGKDKSIRDRLAAGTISSTSALEEALRVRAYSGAIPELHANFAFTKAYMVDRSGSKGGFPGPAMYVDLALFEENVPSWISLESRIPWSWGGITATFGRIKMLHTARAGRLNHRGILDAFGVASRLGHRSV